MVVDGGLYFVFDDECVVVFDFVFDFDVGVDG